MSTWAWLQNQKRKRLENEERERKDRARQQEMEDMQMDMMRSEMESMKSEAAARQATAKSAAPMAKKYMDMWNKSLSRSTGMFNQAMKGVNKGWAAIKDMQKNKVDFSGIINDLQSEWENVKGKFGGLSDQAIEMAGEEMTQRRSMSKQLTKFAQPDYEGAAGRAMADVSRQAEIGRQAESRRLSGLGVDPTSGRGRSAMNTIQGQEALAKAQAATEARRGEKERATGATERAMQLIDPSKTARVATDIQGLKSQLLGQRADVSKAQVGQQQGIAEAIRSMSGAAGQIASGMASGVTAPLGEAAGVYSGMAMQGGMDPISGRSAMPTTQTGGRPMTTMKRRRLAAGMTY